MTLFNVQAELSELVLAALRKHQLLGAILIGLLFAGLTNAQDNPVPPVQPPPTSKPFPLNFDIDFGGMVPSGATSQAYSKSVLVGGGVNVPITRWFTFDLLTIDAGWGTAGGSRIITLNDNSKRSTANYSAQLMSGARVMIPLKRGSPGKLEFGGGFAGIQHREYGVGKVSYVGTGTIGETINCSTCFSTFGSGYYALAQLGARGKHSRGGGVFVKWMEVFDNGKGFSPRVGFPKQQRWITFGVNFSFGFGG